MGGVDIQEWHVTTEQNKWEDLKRLHQFWSPGLECCCCNTNIKSVFQRTITRTIPGTILYISKPVMPIKRKKNLSRKIVSNPWACHKLSYWSFKAALLYSNSHTHSIAPGTAVPSTLNINFFLQHGHIHSADGGVTVYSQDQNNFKKTLVMLWKTMHPIVFLS